MKSRKDWILLWKSYQSIFHGEVGKVLNSFYEKVERFL